MSLYAALIPFLLLALAGCAHPGGAPVFDCPPRTMPTVRLTRLPEVVVQRNLDLVNMTNRGRLGVLRTLFETVGCTSPSLVEKSTLPFRLPNLSCRLPGELADVIVVGAHFDKPSGSTGLVDNWSGASLLPVLWLSLSHHRRRHSFEFVAFAAEERGLVGSTSFVSSLDAEQVNRIKAMVNIDGLGTGPLRADVGHSDPELVCDFWATSALIDLPVRANRSPAGASGDFEPFRRVGVPVIDLSSLTKRGASSDRTPPDAPEAIDERTYHDSYRLLAVYLAMLDERLQTRDGDAGAPGALPNEAR